MIDVLETGGESLKEDQDYCLAFCGFVPGNWSICSRRLVMRPELEHKLNPLHLYCRLVELHFSTRGALRIARIWATIFKLFKRGYSI